MSTTYKQIAMSPEDLPRQHLYEIRELPETPEGAAGEQPRPPLVELHPKEPGEGARLIVQAEWSWSPMHSRISNWEIGPDDPWK